MDRKPHSKEPSAIPDSMSSAQKKYSAMLGIEAISEDESENSKGSVSQRSKQKNPRVSHLSQKSQKSNSSKYT